MTEDSLRRAIETQKSIQEYAEELSLPDLRSVEEQLTELHEEAKRYGDDSPEWKRMRLEAATRLMTVQSIKRRRIASNAYEPLAKPTKQRKPRGKKYDELERLSVEIARQYVDDGDPAFDFPYATKKGAAERVINELIDRRIKIGALSR